MSAIFGKVNFLDKNIQSQRTYEHMKKGLENYKIDNYQCICGESVLFACAHQYITKESKYDILPYYHCQDNIYFTADCMIDNRNQLLSELNLPNNSPDGQLIFYAYLKWGEQDVCNHLIGAYSFAIYHHETKRFLLYTDHTSTRCVYYSIQGDSLAFSTTITPILYGFPTISFPLNEKWITACECNSSPHMLLNPNLSPYEGIFHLPNGHYLWAEHNKNGLIQYWNPLQTVQPLQNLTRNQYKELVLNTLQDCIVPLLREESKIGMLLSSGIDSGAVACLIAQHLKEKEGTLLSYTSVPLPAYSTSNSAPMPNCIDESVGVNLICKTYPNIIPQFITSEHITPISEAKRITDYLELPSKANRNLYWLDNIYKIAKNDGCRIVIDGQNGNSTISYGNYLSYPYQKWKSKEYLTALKTIKHYKNIRKISYYKIIRIISMSLIHKKYPDISILKTSLLHSSLHKKYNIKHTLADYIKFQGGSYMDSREEMLHNMFNPLFFQHTGIHATKMGLANGIIVRDSFRNKNLIELCMSLPVECFFKNGFGRVVAREFLWDIVPHEILQNKFGIGMQSADFCYRIGIQWNEVKDEFLSTLNHPLLFQYIDHYKQQKLIKNLCKGSDQWSTPLMNQALSLASFSYFLQDYESKKNLLLNL